MTLSNLPLSYCTNVHSGRSLAEVDDGLDRYTAPLAERFGSPLAAGLWLAAPVIAELSTPGAVDRFAERLTARGLTCHTLNAFPYGDFHSDRVKEQVYLPDWTDPRRLQYTLDCARVLSRLLPGGVDGSISTVPLGFKEFDHAANFDARAIGRLCECAVGLHRLAEETGGLVRLAIEPEPFCLLETTDEAIAFFERLRSSAADADCLDAVQRHLGLCYDVCHQSVEFEDVAVSIRSLTEAGVRLNKIHITCALQLDDPAGNADGRTALSRYVEPRYLHQTMTRTRAGEVLRLVDLNADFVSNPPAEWQYVDCWRVHFHVPVNAESLGPLKTTRDDLRRGLAAVAELDYAPHLEVETYTWEVLPDGEATRLDLVTGLAAELTATRTLLDETTP